MKKQLKKQNEISNQNNEYSFGKFIQKNWILSLILCLIPIIVLIVFIILMAKKICDVSDLGSMLGDTLAFVGTVLLGAVSVWQVERQRKENIVALQNQNFEIYKGIVQIYIEVLFNDTILVIKNIGNSPISNGSIQFEKTWIDKFDEFGENSSKIKESMLKSLSNNLYLAPEQEIRFYLKSIGENNDFHNFLSTKNCIGTLNYFTLNKQVCEKFDISFCAVLSSFYGQNFEEKRIVALGDMQDASIKSMKNLISEVKDLKNTLSKIPEQIITIKQDTNDSTKN